MKYIGLHGIYSNGSQSTDLILRNLQHNNHKVTGVSYSLNVLDLYNKRSLNAVVDDIEHIYEENDVIIAHSAGCVLTILLAQRLALRGIKIPVVWFFNACVDNKITLPKSIGQLYNIRDMHDNILLLTRIIPSDLIGDLGRVGYEGKNQNVTDLHLRQLLHNDGLNHSDIFERKNVETISRIIAGD